MTMAIVEPIAVGTPASKPTAKMAGRYAAKRKSEPAQTPIARNTTAAATLAAAMITPMYAGVSSLKRATRSRMSDCLRCGAASKEPAKGIDSWRKSNKRNRDVMLIVLQTSAGARLVFQSRFLTDSNPEQDSGFKTERLITARLGQETAATRQSRMSHLNSEWYLEKTTVLLARSQNSSMVQRNSQASLDHFMGRGDV